METAEPNEALSLLKQYDAVLNQLVKLGVVRSANNPTGDYAEWLVASKLGLKLESNSKKGYDATDAEGRRRYQIKGRRITSANPSVQLGIIRNLSEKKFDFLVGIIFGADWQVLRAVKIEYNKVVKMVTANKHQNGHIMHLRHDTLEEKGMENISHYFQS